MPGDAYKSAAVPFVNQKGERSMKRVKVERYVAGKQPSYAKKEDDDEYYTTDEEYSDEEDNRSHVDSDTNEPRTSIYGQGDDVSMSERDDTELSYDPSKLESQFEYDDESSDDPLLRALRHNAITRVMNALDLQLACRAITKVNNQMLFEDEDEDVRDRHLLVKEIVVEETSNIEEFLDFDDYDRNLVEIWQKTSGNRRYQREETEDILKDLKLEGFLPGQKQGEESKIESSIKEMIDQAKEDAIFKAQIYKKIEEDNKIEKTIEALSKDELSLYDMESANTEDEDDDIAYAEWKLREMKRILRDRTARLIESKNKTQPVR